MWAFGAAAFLSKLEIVGKPSGCKSIVSAAARLKMRLATRFDHFVALTGKSNGC
jgi:hypothetical protein